MVDLPTPAAGKNADPLSLSAGEKQIYGPHAGWQLFLNPPPLQGLGRVIIHRMAGAAIDNLLPCRPA